MKVFFSKLFNIRAEEWPRVILLFLIIALTNMAAIWGSTTAYAAFLQQVGIEALPWVLVLSAGLSLVAIAIYSAFVDRSPHERILIALFWFGIASIGLGVGLIGFNRSSIAYPILSLLFLAWTTVFNPHFITYVNSFYDTQAAKRVLPVVLAGARVGAIAAGLTMPVLTEYLSPAEITVLWLLIYLLVVSLIYIMPYFFRRKTAANIVPESIPTVSSTRLPQQVSSYRENMREGFRYVTQSTYLRWMALGTLLLMILLAFLEYRSSQILLGIYGTQKELASFLALLVGVSNIVVLPLLLFVVSRLITRLGLANMSLFFPLGNLLACSYLLVHPGLFSAAAAYLDRTAFRISFQYPIDGLLYNAVPLRVKGRARAFIGGLIVPVGSLLGGSVLMLPLVRSVWWVLPVLIGMMAIAYTVCAFIIRRQYSQALIAMLEQEDYSFLLAQEVSDLSTADPTTLALLQKKLKESRNYEITVFMAQLISQLGGKRAVPILEEEARNTSEAKIRDAIIDVMVATDLRGPEVWQMYRDFLNDPDGEVRRSALVGFMHLSDPHDPQVHSQLLKLLQDPDLDVRVQVLSALADTDNFYEHSQAMEALEHLLHAEDPYQRRRGVSVLGQIGGERAIRRLKDFLANTADEVRLAAALALESVASDTLSSDLRMAIVEQVELLIGDPIERVRQAALMILGRMNIGKSHEALINALTDSSDRIRATAVDVLVQGGKAIVPVIHPHLSSTDPRLRKMAAVILSRINPREFSAMITSANITGNLLSIYRNYGLVEALKSCNMYAGITILQSSLKEGSQQLVEEIFYFLEAIHDPASIKLIRESFHSDSSHIRANALEALESITSPQTASLIEPLFVSQVDIDQLLSSSRDVWNMDPPDTNQALQQLLRNTENPWLRAITTFALGEIGATLSSASTAVSSGNVFETDRTVFESQDPAKRTKRRRRTPRKLPDDLFSTGADSSGERRSESDAREKNHSQTTQALQAQQFPLRLAEIEQMIEYCLHDPVEEVRHAAQVATTMLGGRHITETIHKEERVLSVIEKIIFLKEVPFFHGMTIEQLRILASVCEEQVFEEDTRIFHAGDPGGALYVVVNGRVGIEQEKRRGSFARLANIEAHSYFGEMNLFDNSPHSISAIALQDTLTLRLRREPLIALARQYPELSLELINVLSQRLREANDRIAELTKTRPRELHKLFDQFDSTE